MLYVVLAGAEIAADFEDTPLLGQREWREELQFDAVTCMFAIHYFFESEKAIKTFLHNVSINLKEGDLHTFQPARLSHQQNMLEKCNLLPFFRAEVTGMLMYCCQAVCFCVVRMLACMMLQ